MSTYLGYLNQVSCRLDTASWASNCCSQCLYHRISINMPLRSISHLVLLPLSLWWMSRRRWLALLKNYWEKCWKPISAHSEFQQIMNSDKILMLNVEMSFFTVSTSFSFAAVGCSGCGLLVRNANIELDY